jgi:hypothetical protein
MLAGALVVLGGVSSALAQSAVVTSATSNGGDLHEGSYGEIYSTIGEPVASDSLSVTDNESTWTGFWQVMPIGPVAGIREEISPWGASATAIAAAAPEPFASELDIKVGLARPGQVRLIVFDMLGRPVGTLIDGHREAGTLRVFWAPEGLDGGSYILQLLVDGESYGSRLVHYYH